MANYSTFAIECERNISCSEERVKTLFLIRKVDLFMRNNQNFKKSMQNADNLVSIF